MVDALTDRNNKSLASKILRNLENNLINNGYNDIENKI